MLLFKYINWGVLGCGYMLAIVNYAVKNTGIVCVGMFLILVHVACSYIAGLKVTLCLTIWGDPGCLLIWLDNFMFLTAMYKLLHGLGRICSLLFDFFFHPRGCKGTSCFGFSCVSLWLIMLSITFCAYWITCISSLKKCLYKSFLHLKI